ncbi:MAG: hypothetical protein F6J97_12885, partial [Leptolyngbya sp. SIO4C1]|nr:hypothetical protein [Leptolyngbya sp. SIO4C1]
MISKRITQSAAIAGTLSFALFSSLLGSLLSLPSQAQTAEPDASAEADLEPLPDDARFECQIHERQFTVMYLPESQPDQAYPWAVPEAMGGGWSAERRCFEISDRLERYRPEGLQELRTGIENGYDTVCATTEQNPDLCQIVFTV